MPSWANGDEQWQVRFREVWDHTLAQAPWLFAADQQMLEASCVAHVDAARLGHALMRSPCWSATPAPGAQGVDVRREWQSVAKTCLSLAQEFWLTPSARRGLVDTVASTTGLSADTVGDDLVG